MTLLLLIVLSSSIVIDTFGFEHTQIKTKKRTLKEEFDLNIVVYFPIIPGIPEAEVSKYCLQISQMQENRSVAQVMDRVLANAKYDNPELQPIFERYVCSIISLAYKEKKSVEQVMDTIHRDMNIVGFIIYGTQHRTSAKKWKSVQQEIKAEVSQSGFRLDGI